MGDNDSIKVDDDTSSLCNYQKLSASSSSSCHVTYSGLPEIDRSCLLVPPNLDRVIVEFSKDNNCNFSTIVDFVNIMTHSFYPTSLSPDNHLYKTLIDSGMENQFKIETNGMTCDRIDMKDLSRRIFIDQYLLVQKPLIITGIEAKKSSSESSTIVDILRNYLDSSVDAKCSPTSDFEGVEKLSEWEKENNGNSRQQVPPDVLRQLESPDLVVVRADHKRMKLRELMDTIAEKYTLCKNENKTGAALGGERIGCPESNIYIEYLNLKWHLHGLLNEVDDAYGGGLESMNKTLFNLFSDRNAYIWIGDGNTVGKLHFDAFDNILVQLEGSKKFRMVDPLRNERLYEGHMREAILTSSISDSRNFDSQLLNYAFHKTSLLEATSMVHSPINIEQPNFDRYPDVPPGGIPYMDCTVQEGEAIFVPSYFWHEVSSSPGQEQKYNGNSAFNDNDPLPKKFDRIAMNVAINYWFSPLYKKEFPCKSCRKKFNYEEYSSIIRDWV